MKENKRTFTQKLAAALIWAAALEFTVLFVAAHTPGEKARTAFAWSLLLIVALIAARVFLWLYTEHRANSRCEKRADGLECCCPLCDPEDYAWWP
jgi:hypothetical protein